jgi:drug/metabolite transporter, DME family
MPRAEPLVLPSPARASAGRARLLVVAAALLFATGGTAIKLSALTGWQIAGLRSAVAAGVLALCLPAWRPTFRPAELGVGLVYASTLVLFVTANTLTTAANAIFLQSTAPLYVLLLGPRLLGERSRRGDLGLVALIAAGLVLIAAAAQAPLRTAPEPGRGNAIAALSGVSWAFTLMGLRWLGGRAGAPGRDVTGGAIVTGNLIALLVCAPWIGSLGGVGAADAAILVYLGAVQIGLAYVCLVSGVRGLPALEVALLLAAEPVLSALVAWAVHAEQPGWTAIAGYALIGLALVAQARRAPPS